MLYEQSFGAVIYRKQGQQIFYLLLLYQREKRSWWDFPKGHKVAGEQPRDVVRREVTEETGLTRLDFASGFEEKTHFMFRNAGELVSKDVTFFLAITPEEKVTLSSEHAGIRWFSYEEALETLTFKNSKEVLQKAHTYLTSGKVQFQQTLL